MRRAAPVLLAVLALTLAGPARAAETHPLLASAPVDTAVFRDGEVQRSATPFGRWTLVCDAIARLGHKFCSLRSAEVRLGGAAVALLVSTGDDGRPAALLRLPFGLSLPFGVLIAPLDLPHAPAHHVPIALCAAAGCEAVWTLTPAEIAALRTGQGLQVAVRGWQFGATRRRPTPPVTATFPPDGFTNAITASLR